uniref:Uncharacterized protein n=1 Tax=Acrobeloides nanus TaxID=290746 RepID=A0A914BZA1_9BILA
MAVVKPKNEEIQVKPEEVSAEVLKEIKRVAETVTGQKNISKAVITVPAYFRLPQKYATKKAAEMAGLQVMELLTEPNAAAYSYGFHEKNLVNCNLMVFDFGGGTLDIVIINVKNGHFNTVSVGGDMQLGGRNIDELLMTHFAAEIEKERQDFFQEHQDCFSDPKWKHRLKTECIRVKIELSSIVNETSELFIDEILRDSSSDGVHITREKFEELIQPILTRIELIIHEVLNNAPFQQNNIDEILMIGGSSRIPAVHRLLESIFPGKKLNHSEHPDEAVAIGAAIRAAQFSTISRNETPNWTIQDILPLSIGEMVNNPRGRGGMEKIFSRGTPFPTPKVKRESYTIFNDQEVMEIKIYEGERPVAGYNNLLLSTTFDGVKPGMAGTQKLTMEYHIDCLGLLNMVATYDGRTREYSPFEIFEKENRVIERNENDLLREANLYQEMDKAERQLLDKEYEILLYCEQIDYKLRSPDDFSTPKRKRTNKEVKNETTGEANAPSTSKQNQTIEQSRELDSGALQLPSFERIMVCSTSRAPGSGHTTETPSTSTQNQTNEQDKKPQLSCLKRLIVCSKPHLTGSRPLTERSVLENDTNMPSTSSHSEPVVFTVRNHIKVEASME